MERVRKTFFDPLATTKAQIREILEEQPVGSAHPFSPERILLCRTEDGIEEIDISSYPEDYFFNAVDLGEMGDILLRRMAGFQTHLSVFEDFHIQQAPASTFRIPLVSGEITILAVSERTPTYYDFCFADATFNTCCWLARDTFPGINHSGDILNGQDLLDFVRIDKQSLTDKEICVFISGYQCTQITRFLGTHPALLVANHVDKILYIIPVPLDAATIADATICCPLVIKRDGDSLICSILPKATTDRGMMCSGSWLGSPCFPEAIKRADFTIAASQPTVRGPSRNRTAEAETRISSATLSSVMAKEHAILTTNLASLPSCLDLHKQQIISFGTGMEFDLADNQVRTKPQSSAVVLPCIFGSQLQGPVLLATGTIPSNVPFSDEKALRDYYMQLKTVVVVVDERMTDNARNLAPAFRINALFIVQLSPQDEPSTTDDVLSLLNSANINAVTALAGPQSLVIVQIFNKYYFYRGLANRTHLNTSRLAFGSDITSTIESVDIGSMIDPRVERIINLEDANTIILPASGQMIRPQDLQALFEELTTDKIQDLEEDIYAAVPQLQVLLDQKDLQDLSKSLVSALSNKISAVTGPLREAYVKFLSQEYNMADPESVKKRNSMLGELRKATKNMQKSLEPAISSLATMMSTQTTSKRTHDLKRLVRQAQIKDNVEAAKSMTFETLAGYLETYAADMGVMLLNIEATPYSQLLANLKSAAIDASPCCDLDSRILHLEGLDAGIIMEQSQSEHNGPLTNQAGPSQPIMALPNLNQGIRTGSMLAWVCWDEFVNLESPYTVKWVEKCNEAHIAALRIVMRATLSQAVASREHDIQPGSVEAGHLMSALLMATMSKLAAMRTSPPRVTEKAEDTVTRLMRGLFGNLLTTAGSGVRPLSMVWQLFGLNPQYDIPTTNVGWVWYETVVALYPYTGWPLDQFYENLEKLLDKAIVRVVTKSESVAQIKQNRVAEMIRYCKLRNIQLDHSRTIITILMRMLTTDNIDIAAASARLLGKLPPELERQTEGYTRMMEYLAHLANGGQRRTNDDLVAANIYTRRSAAFAALKANVADACQDNDWVEMKQSCQALLDKHAETAALWHIKPASLKMQNMKLYKELLNADFGEEVDEETKSKNRDLTRQVLGDAERWRVPWQVGKEGQFGDKIEPLHEEFVHEILTGSKPESVAITESQETQITGIKVTGQQEMANVSHRFSEFASSMQASFIATMEKSLSSEDVCGIVKIPVSTMRVFVKALNPEFVWEDLGENFKLVMYGLLKDRSNRAESRPAKKLLNLGRRKGSLQIEG